MSLQFLTSLIQPILLIGVDQNDPDEARRIRFVNSMACCGILFGLIYTFIFVQLSGNNNPLYYLPIVCTYLSVFVLNSYGYNRSSAKVLLINGLCHVAGSSLLLLDPSCGADLTFELKNNCGLSDITPVNVGISSFGN